MAPSILEPYCNSWEYFQKQLVDSQALDGEKAPQTNPEYSKNFPEPRKEVPDRFGGGRKIKILEPLLRPVANILQNTSQNIQKRP